MTPITEHNIGKPPCCVDAGEQKHKPFLPMVSLPLSANPLAKVTWF